MNRFEELIYQDFLKILDKENDLDSFFKKYKLENLCSGIINPSKKLIKDINNLSDASKFIVMRCNIMYFPYINDPSDELIIEAVLRATNYLVYVKNPSLNVQMEVVKYSSASIRFIKNPHESVIMESIKDDGYNIQYLHPELQTSRIKKESLKESMGAIQYFHQINHEDIEYVIFNKNKFNNTFDNWFNYINLDKIKDSKSLSLLYMNVDHEFQKNQIRRHKLYKTDAQLILDNLKK